MNEYIIEVDYNTFKGTYSQRRREKIIRCRDCKYYEEKTYKWINDWTRIKRLVRGLMIALSILTVIVHGAKEKSGND